METERLLAQLLLRHRDEAGGLLPLLHDVQDMLGFIPPAALPAIAEAQNLSVADVRGVISFYDDFRTAPAGRHILRVCRAESCQAVGGEALAAAATEILGVGFGETTGDGAVTLASVYCLGNCACSPSVAVNERSYARVDREQLEQLCRSLREDPA